MKAQRTRGETRIEDEQRILREYGGYGQLKSYRMSEIVFDGTLEFCERHVDRFSRTYDQMVQAARSGKQNIVEGSVASATSQTMEMKLTGVSKPSLEELLDDYRDFLRNKGLRLWGKDSPEALEVRGICRGDRTRHLSYSSYQSYIRHSPGWAANTLICLIHQCTYLLRRQLLAQEARLLESGSFRERVYQARSARRRRAQDG